MIKMKAIIVSEKDLAGMSIHDELSKKGFKPTDRKWLNKTLLKKGQWFLARVESRIIYADEVADLNVDEVIFASKHSSKSGEPTLTTHAPGNFGPADYGGNPGEICYVHANRMKEIYSHLINPPFEYEVSLEVTHHGPLIPQPCVFVELGSTEKQWKNQEAAEYLAEAIIQGTKKEPKERETAIGIGGNHYAPKFTQVQEEEDTAIGHIIPRYAQDHLDRDMVQQMIEKTHPKPDKIYIDKKGTRKQAKVRKMIEGLDEEVNLL